jgi:hypothetical protein
MSAIHSHPRIATLRRKPSTQCDQWIIYSTTPDHGFTALHEVIDESSISTVVEQIPLESAFEMENFSSSLTNEGWIRCDSIRPDRITSLSRVHLQTIR